jgi:hypothetical protein
VRAFLAIVLLVLCLASAASAKLRMSLSLSPSSPRAHEPVHVLVRAEESPGGACSIHVVAVAPGASVSRAVDGYVGGQSVQGPNGYSVHRMRLTPRLGFSARTQRAGAMSWRATLRFPRKGRWRLVIPNECAPGWMYPWPAMRVVTVR